MLLTYSFKFFPKLTALSTFFTYINIGAAGTQYKATTVTPSLTVDSTFISVATLAAKYPAAHGPISVLLTAKAYV